MKCFLFSFYQNICIFSKNSKIGYILLKDKTNFKIHGASSLALFNENPEFIMCIDLNIANYNFSKIVTAVSPTTITEFTKMLNETVDYLLNPPQISVFEKLQCPSALIRTFTMRRDFHLGGDLTKQEIDYYTDPQDEKIVFFSSKSKSDLKKIAETLY